MPFRMRLEEELERPEAAHDVLRGIGAVDAQDQLLGPVLGDVVAGLDHGRALRELVPGQVGMIAGKYFFPQRQ